MNSPYVLQVKTYQDDGLSFIFTTEQKTRNLKLDGKDYPKEGPNANPALLSQAGGWMSTPWRGLTKRAERSLIRGRSGFLQTGKH